MRDVGKHIFAVVTLACSLNVVAGGGWERIDVPGSETLNGVSTGQDGFAVLVGNAGLIVHRDPEGNLSLPASKTTEDLFDVFVHNADLAIAAGRDVILLWDGNVWDPILTDIGDIVYTSVWITPQGNTAIINTFNGAWFHRAYFIDTAMFRPGAFGSGLDLAYCGDSDDIKSITENGSIMHFKDDLLPGPGSDATFGVLFDNLSAPLNLTAAWFPPSACIRGPYEPLAAYAIDENRFFYEFSPGTGWELMPVVGGAIPSEHNLNWLGGSSSNNMLAVGATPSMRGPGNTGVVWSWNGMEWAQDLSLPVGTPGLTDVAMAIHAPDLLFVSGFESAMARGGPDPADATTQIFAAAEDGEMLAALNILLTNNFTDLEARKVALDQPPYTDGQTISYELTYINHGPGNEVVEATETLMSGQGDSVLFGEDSAFTFVGLSAGCPLQLEPGGVFKGTFPLMPGQSVSCTIELIINDPDNFDKVGDLAHVRGRLTDIRDRSATLANQHSPGENRHWIWVDPNNPPD